MLYLSSVYYSMHKPLEEIHHRKIVLHSVKNCFTEGIRILINENSVDYYNAFRAACKIGQIEIVKMLLDLDQCDEFLSSFDFKLWRFIYCTEYMKSKSCKSGKFDIEKVPLQKTVTSGLFSALVQTTKNWQVFWFNGELMSNMSASLSIYIT